VLDPLLEQTSDGALRRADRTVHQDDALFWAVTLRGGLQHVHEAHERDVEPEDGVSAAVDGIREERIALEALLIVDVLLFAVTHDHVVKALKRIARDLRALTHHLQIFLEASLPMQVSIRVVVLKGSDARDHLVHEL
jgi:hypothetical protein